MTRTEIINLLIHKHGYKTYLEIGVETGINFRAIEAPVKEGIDPDETSYATKHITSDRFWMIDNRMWDIIFIDGLHHHKQVIKDINNALDRLNPGGTIVVHDCNPTTELMQRVPRESREWTGDVWKSWVWFRSIRSNLLMYVVNTDYGVGIIQRGSQKRLDHLVGKNLDYDLLKKYRRGILNLMSVNKFVEKYGYKDYDDYQEKTKIDTNYITDVVCNRLDGNEWKYINNLRESDRLKPGDWLCLRKPGTMWLQPDYLTQLHHYIKKHPEAGVFLAMTNNCVNPTQCQNNNSTIHRPICDELKIAKERFIRAYDDSVPAQRSPVGDHMLLVSPKVWDTEFTTYPDVPIGEGLVNIAYNKELKVYIMRGVYVYNV